MFDGRWREAVDRRTGPVGRALHRRGITADVLTATGLRHRRRDGRCRGAWPPPPGHRAAHRDRRPRLARRPGGQGGGDRLGAGRLLRLGDRPGHRCGPDGWGRLVPGVGPQGPAGAPPAGRPRGHGPRLLRAGQSRSPGAVGGQGGAHGAGRAHDPARRGLPGLLAAGAGAVDPARSGDRSPPWAGSSGSGRLGPTSRARKQAPPPGGCPGGRSAARSGRVSLAAWREGRRHGRVAGGPASRSDGGGPAAKRRWPAARVGPPGSAGRHGWGHRVQRSNTRGSRRA